MRARAKVSCIQTIVVHLHVVRKWGTFYTRFRRLGIFPDTLKTGLVSPIYKKGDPQLLDNYRPISTLPIFSKIFEKLIYTRIYDFLVAKNVLYEKQFGFRRNHSTSHAINY